MEYQNVVRDFAERTRRNLHLLRRLQQENSELEVYEVTQLVNSMLGLLVFPQQCWYEQIPETPLSKLKEQGWPIPRVVGDFLDPTDLRQLVRYLRNAVSHFNIRFSVDDEGQIAGLTVWNRPPRSEINWRAELSLEEIELITEKFLDLLTAQQVVGPSQGQFLPESYRP